MEGAEGAEESGQMPGGWEIMGTGHRLGLCVWTWRRIPGTEVLSERKTGSFLGLPAG